MADDNEDQMDRGDETVDNYPADFGRLYDPSLKARTKSGRQILGANMDHYPAGYAAAFAAQTAAQRVFANEGMRQSLAASLLQGNATKEDPERWGGLAKKALAAATIIYPEIKEPA